MHSIAKRLFITLFFATSFLNAQIDEWSDSLDIVDLRDVVITGQYSAQSVDRSLYQVEVITPEDIKNQAGNTVADVLNQKLNILIVSSPDSGDSGLELMSLKGSYIKVLVDNIPLVGDSGMGNNIDLTKINLDDVERIEIVKGAMGVDYGNNALAGIVNIITKKTIKTDWKIRASLQEETVGKEYDWYKEGGKSKGKGRHIQSIDIARTLSNRWNVSAGMNHNDFMGFRGERKGRMHFGQDEQRGYEWLPKNQYNSYGLINYSSPGFKAFYRISFLSEKIKFYDSTVNMLLFEDGERTFVANDRDYLTKRWTHHLNISARLFGRVNYDGDFSYQTQKRQFEDYVFDIPARKVISSEDPNVYLSTKAWYSRGTFSRFIDHDHLDYQIGYEVDFNKGFANSISNDLGLDENIHHRVDTYAGFISMEYKTDFGLSLRPGFRASFSNRFDTKYTYSLSTKYDLSHRSHLRAVVGTANRYPGFEELFTRTVNANHDIRGDENLKPEDGFSASLLWNRKGEAGEVKMENDISVSYIGLKGKIELVNTIPQSPTYRFMNIDKFKTMGMAADNRFIWGDWNWTAGISLFGVSKSLYSNAYRTEKGIDDKYKFNFQATASVNWKYRPWDMTVSAYYKYMGKTSEFVLDPGSTIDGGESYTLLDRKGFSLMDLSVRKDFFQKKLEATLGVRNLFDVTELQSSGGASSTGHSEASGAFPIFYGRSYFLKLNYTLDF